MVPMALIEHRSGLSGSFQPPEILVKGGQRSGEELVKRQLRFQLGDHRGSGNGRGAPSTPSYAIGLRRIDGLGAAIHVFERMTRVSQTRGKWSHLKSATMSHSTMLPSARRLDMRARITSRRRTLPMSRRMPNDLSRGSAHSKFLWATHRDRDDGHRNLRQVEVGTDRINHRKHFAKFVRASRRVYSDRSADCLSSEFQKMSMVDDLFSCRSSFRLLRLVRIGEETW